MSKPKKEVPPRYTTFMTEENRRSLKIFAAATDTMVFESLNWLVENYLPAPKKNESYVEFGKRCRALIKRTQSRKST